MSEKPKPKDKGHTDIIGKLNETVRDAKIDWRRKELEKEKRDEK